MSGRLVPIGFSHWRSAIKAVAVGAMVFVGGAVSAVQVDAAVTGGAGAPLPYVELQAESASTTGAVIGPTSVYNTLPDEASMRKAVTLTGSQYVRFTVPSAFNSIVVRYSIPDSSDGSVYNATMNMSINGGANSTLPLTNAYSWYYSSYPFSNSPGGGNAHHFYDEVHKLLSPTAAGSTVQLSLASGASSLTIDLADFENVPAAIAQPAGSVSVTSFGGDASGVNDSTAAFNSAIASAGSGGTVWIPQGTFKVTSHIIVNNVTVTGAGMWYSNAQGAGVGFYGNYAPSPSTNVHLSNFLITGDVQERNDGAQVNGIGGALTNSTVDHVWIEHTKVGAWMDGPFTGLALSYMRIRDQTADGVNFHDGITNSSVTNSDIRNTGDDGLATWSDTNADANDTFDHNTVSLQTLANGIAIYGGHDNTVSNNRVVDTGLSQGGGIHVAQRFASTPLGATHVTNNTLIRDGSLDPNWQFGVGALWFDARDGAMTGAVTVDNILIQQSPYEAIQFVSGSSISNVTISNALIQITGTFTVQEQVGGAATFTNVVQSGTLGYGGIYNCGVAFTLTDGGGNSGWNGTPVCVAQPNNIPLPPYVATGLVASPSAVVFGSQATGTTSTAQTVTLTNTDLSSITVSAVSVSGDFTQTNNCATLAANASCTVNVTFRPTATGTRTGTLSVTSNASASPSVSLTGTGTAPGPVLNATPSALSFGSTVVGQTTATQAVTISNAGTTSATVSAVSVTGDFTQTNSCTTIAVGASCTASVAFRPTVGGARTGTLTVTSNANNSPTTVSLSGSGIDWNTNIAAGRPATDSSEVGGFPATNVTDADINSYWESANGAFPQWIQVDLGATFSVGRLVLHLPPSSAWGDRSQTLSVQGSTNGTTFTQLVASAGYLFSFPSNNNTVTINLPAGSSARYVRLNITANTGWAAGQLSQFEIYPGSGVVTGSGTLSASPTSLTFASTNVGSASTSQNVTITNSGSAATTVSAVAVNGDYSQTNTCTSIAAGGTCTVGVTFRPTAAGTRTGTLTVTSNATNSPTTVSLTGTGVATNANLALGKSMTASSVQQVYGPGNANDNNQATYWESANNAFPQWLQVDLGANNTVGRVLVQLPTTWGTRTQTFSVLGSTNGTTWTTLKGSAVYTFNPAANTVTITFTAASVRYVRLNFTANSVQPGGQCSEFQVYNS